MLNYQKEMKTKLFIKRLEFLLYCVIMLIIAYLLDRFYQMLIFLLLFNFIHDAFRYRFHADTIIKDPIKSVRWCKVITIFVHIIYLILCGNLNISIYYNLLIIFLITLLNCLLEYSIHSIIVRNIKLCDCTTLVDMCKQANISYDAQRRLIMRYVQHKSIREIAHSECVDEQSIKISLNRSLKRLKELNLIEN